MSKQTQISLDFGPEEQMPPASTGDNGAGNDPARHYMAAGGVGVRVKSYKQTPVPGGGDLFGDAVASSPTVPSVAAGTVEPATNGLSEPPAIEESLAEIPVGGAGPAAAGIDVTEPIAIATAAAETNLAKASTAALPEAPAAVSPTVAVPTSPANAVSVAALPEAQVEASEVALPVLPAKASTADTPLPRRQVSAKSTAARQKTPPPQTPSKRGRKSLKQVSAEADLIEIPVDEVLFSKQYYTMGEVSEMFRVNQSLLRFWESEFDILQPRKNKKGDRYFRPVDIKNLHLIYHLLRQKKYTIEGAKEFLKKNKKADERFEVIQRLQEIKSFLLEMKAQL
jgi:DNA-binding transcriptional MerR regulator